MAAQKIPQVISFPQAVLPKSLQEALKCGWKINEQLSAWSFQAANSRDGFLFLTRKGAGKGPKTLIVPFAALYKLWKPYFLDPVQK
jgi:hypothetical protein